MSNSRQHARDRNYNRSHFPPPFYYDQTREMSYPQRYPPPFLHPQRPSLFPGYAPQQLGVTPAFQRTGFQPEERIFSLMLEEKRYRERQLKKDKEYEELKAQLEEVMPEGRKIVAHHVDDEDDDDMPIMTPIAQTETALPGNSTLKKHHKRKRKRSSSSKHRRSSKKYSRHHRKSKKRKYDEKRRSSSSSSFASSSATDSGSSSENRSHKHRRKAKDQKKKHSRRHEKRKRRYRSTSSSSNSILSTSRSSSSSKERNRNVTSQQQAPEIQRSSCETMSSAGGMLDVRNNPWELLKPKNYNFRQKHIVIDSRGDSENLMFDHYYKKQVAIYNSIDTQALSDKMQLFIFKEIDKKELTNDRYFNPQLAKFFQRGRCGERRFRCKAPIEEANGYLAISNYPCGSDQEIEMKKETFTLEESSIMDLNDYETSCNAKELSYEQTDLEGRLLILRAKCVRNSTDVDAWIEFVKLRKQKMAQDEGETPDADVKNKCALFDIQQDILLKAIKANPGSVDLALEKLKILEEYYGIDSREVQDGWRNLENRFINSLKMWKLNLQMKQNNRTTFELSRLISLLDKCLENLVDLKDGVKLSHQPPPNVEQFLMDRVVHRCKLLLETGYTERVVATLQALTEFHFFAPKQDESLKTKTSRSRVLIEPMRTFWEVALPRIGDEGALGWKNSDFTADMFSQEADALRIETQEIQQKETELMTALDRAGRPSNVDAWRQVEQFRTEQFWHPVRYVHAQEIIEYTSRHVDFDVFSKTLFTFDNKTLPLELIFRIAQLLGAVIPGMPEQSQSDILRQLSGGDFTQIFPRMEHNYRDIVEFFDKYFDLLMSAEGVDRRRVMCAKLATRVKSLKNASSETINKNIQQWMREVHESNESTTNKATFFFYLAKLIDSFGMHNRAMKMVTMILQGLRKPLWSSELKETERALYLEIIRWLCRQLPFRSTVIVKEERLEIDSKIPPKTKFDVLLWFGVSGYLQPVQINNENMQTARLLWRDNLCKDRMSTYEPPNWFFNEADCFVELAAIFFYEYTGHQLSTFNKILEKSPAGIHVGMSPNIFETQLEMYEHKMRTSTIITPRDRNKLLRQALLAYSTHTGFMKRFVDTCRSFDVRNFIQDNTGNDEFSRRVQLCALVYLEWRNYISVMQVADEMQKKRAFSLLRNTLEKAAGKLLEESDFPDAYVWCLLMHIEQSNASPIRRIDELFALAQKQCPWSKRLLYETSRKRTDADGFQTTLTSIILRAGIQQYCRLDEIPLLYEADVDHEDEYLEDESQLKMRSIKDEPRVHFSSKSV